MDSSPKNESQWTKNRLRMEKEGERDLLFIQIGSLCSGKINSGLRYKLLPKWWGRTQKKRREEKRRRGAWKEHTKMASASVCYRSFVVLNVVNLSATIRDRFHLPLGGSSGDDIRDKKNASRGPASVEGHFSLPFPPWSQFWLRVLTRHFQFAFVHYSNQPAGFLGVGRMAAPLRGCGPQIASSWTRDERRMTNEFVPASNQPNFFLFALLFD